MKLLSWDAYINELKLLLPDDVEVLTIINSRDIKDISYLLSRDNFTHKVAIDPENIFFKANKFPSKEVCYTFLLDSEDKVLAIGNPVNNPKVRELYYNIMTGEEIQRLESRNILIHQPVKSFGVIANNDTVYHSFEIVNNDSITYHIQDLVPSCDCISATVGVDTILPDSIVNIDVKFVSDSVNKGNIHRYIDVYYKEKEYPERLVLYGYLK
ncbi:MAG: DUF1573 domain-containing protein [Muribaculaceae bacterium]|nr:DUF1573 domain-containing protein [Muribaculaceae bacterium]